MAYLLDTSAYLFLLQEPERLSAAQVTALQSGEPLLLSYASVLEMAMLMRKGRLRITFSLSELLRTQNRLHRIRLLPVRPVHYQTTATLPLHRDHADPMDLLLIAQALTENLAVLTSDRKFQLYVPDGLRVVA